MKRLTNFLREVKWLPVVALLVAVATVVLVLTGLINLPVVAALAALALVLAILALS